MSLREDLKDVSFELARIIKEKKDRIEAKSDVAMKFIIDQSKKRVRVDLLRIMNEMINEKYNELNKHETAQINQINATTPAILKMLSKVSELKPKVDLNVDVKRVTKIAIRIAKGVYQPLFLSICFKWFVKQIRILSPVVKMKSCSILI